MPAITITAIDTTANTLTAAAHGLTTGDRFRLRNVGGALPASTPSLAAVTDYFAIRVDANTIKVSDTNAHALAGTGIFDLTGSLTGTTTVEYGLPFCVPRISGPGVQVFSADLNGEWNSLVAIYDLLTGQAQSIWTGITLPANQSFAVSGTGRYKHGTQTMSVPLVIPGAAASAPTAILTMTSTNVHAFATIIGLPIGKRILTTRAIIQDSATGPTKVQVGLRTANATTFAGGGGTTLTNLGTASAGNGSIQTITSTAINVVTVSGQQYEVAVEYNTGTANVIVGFLEVDFDDP